MMMTDETQEPIEKRDFAQDLRVEQAEDFAPVIRGYPILFNSMSQDLGGFVEIIRPQAMERTLTEGVDLRALVNHDTSLVLGRLSAKTLRVTSDVTGLRMAVYPPNTSYGRDIVESMRRGDVTGGSFAFRIMPGGEKWNFEATPPVREIMDMRVSEVSIVTFPAYAETDVTVAKRSLEANRPTPRPTIVELRQLLAERRARWK
jgi:HK97 family phage prohead protease